MTKHKNSNCEKKNSTTQAVTKLKKSNFYNKKAQTGTTLKNSNIGKTEKLLKHQNSKTQNFDNSKTRNVTKL